MLALDARTQRHELSLLQVTHRSRPPQRRVTAARNRDQRIVKQRHLAKRPPFRREPVDGGVEASLAHSSLELDRPRPRAERDLDSRRGTREPLAHAHRDQRPERMRNPDKESALGGLGIETAPLGDGLTHRPQRGAQLRIDQIGDRRRHDALRLADEELVAEHQAQPRYRMAHRRLASSPAGSPRATGCAPRRPPRIPAAG